MLEQEIASLMRYMLDNAGNPSPYYHEVPQDFLVPAVFFPPPEVSSHGDTLRTYALEYSLFVKFFHSSTPQAYVLGMTALTGILGNHCLIPLILEDGSYASRGFHVKDPRLKQIGGASGVVQLELSWDSPRPYNEPLSHKMMAFNLDMYNRESYQAAVEQLINDKEDDLRE